MPDASCRLHLIAEKKKRKRMRTGKSGAIAKTYKNLHFKKIAKQSALLKSAVTGNNRNEKSGRLELIRQKKGGIPIILMVFQGLKSGFAALVLVCLLCGTGHSQVIKGRVVAIADGDTLTVLDSQNQQHKIRLNGIDAPESGQDFGQVSKRNLSDLAFGKEVVVNWSKVDRYQRLIGTVFVGSTNVNLEQLKAGLAWYYRQYAGDVPQTERAKYEGAENEARAGKRGLWQQSKPVPPWEFRHPEQAEPSATATGSANTATTGRIIGNRNSGIYHLPNCPDYSKVSERNREYFNTEADAVKAGFRKARNCP